MSGITAALYTAKEGLLSNLTAINVTGSNIANVNTPGYTRLRPMFESTGTMNAASDQGQTGVRIAGIEQIFDKYLNYQIVQQQSFVANYTAQQDLLQRVESILNENNGGGINDALGKFLNAWGNLSSDSSSKSKRDMVVSTGENLAYVFNQRSEELSNLQIMADDNVADAVSTLNGYLTQMAKYNETIVNAEMSGDSASSLRDKRGALLNDISSILDINYVEKSDGSLYISLATNGKALVEGFKSWELTTDRDDNSNLYNITLKNDPTQQSINAQITGGKLAGLLEVRDTLIPSYLNELNQTASSIINKVNELHTSGYDQDGNTGDDFFDVSNPKMFEARYMQVNDAIASDTRKIAASATINADGDNATAITAINNDQMYASLGAFSISDPTAYASGQINNIGQAYKETLTGHPITLSRGPTTADWTITDDGGYDSAKLLTANDSSVTLDLNDDGTVDITFALSGSWNTGDTLSFSLAKRGNTTTIDGYFNAFIANMGQDVVNASQAIDRETTILNQQIEEREQLSGVSLDEEMVNLIKFQMAYGAAGRMTKTISEIMDILMNLGQ